MIKTDWDHSMTGGLGLEDVCVGGGIAGRLESRKS